MIRLLLSNPFDFGFVIFSCIPNFNNRDRWLFQMPSTRPLTFRPVPGALKALELSRRPAILGLRFLKPALGELIGCVNTLQRSSGRGIAVPLRIQVSGHQIGTPERIGGARGMSWVLMNSIAGSR